MSDGADGSFDDIDTVADEIVRLPAPVLFATDVDGTLAPLVDDPDLARLQHGALDGLWFLQLSGRRVAVISGRPMEDLTGLFGLPDEFVLIGSHGAEVGGPAQLTTDEHERLAEVKRLMAGVVASAPGSHVEHKPVAAAFHVRRASPAIADAALARLRLALAAVPGITVHEGHAVIEASVRTVHKAAAMARLIDEQRPASVVFLGDDAADERVFAALAAGDMPHVTVKVGEGTTLATRRLPDPAAVVAVLQAVGSAK